MSEEKTKESITIKKDHLYLGVVGLLAILLIASIFSGGFGIVKSISSTTGSTTTTNIRTAPSGGEVLIDSLIDDDQKLGSDNAPIVLIEFSDFQCPFCRIWWSDSLTNLENDYIKTGKVQFVYRDFPLSFHPGAQPAAEGAECARDQGKWREMHDKIFEEQTKQGQGTIQFFVQDVKKWASQINKLDVAKFNACLDSGKYTQEVQKDFTDGSQVGISGTPGFVIGKRGGQGQLIVGAQPYSVFKQAIDSLLSKKSKM